MISQHIANKDGWVGIESRAALIFQWMTAVPQEPFLNFRSVFNSLEKKTFSNLDFMHKL